MKKIKFKYFGLIFVAILMLCSIFIDMKVEKSVSAATDPSLEKQISTYQGEHNWYYYSGDFSEMDLRYMLYSPLNNLWQGQEEFSRVYSLALIQMPSENYDTIRAKVISKNGKLSLKGSVGYYSDEGTGTTVSIGIMLAQNGDLSKISVLKDYTMLSSQQDNFRLEDAVEEISVSSGDVLFFIAQATGEKSAGVVFDVNFDYTEIISSSYPTNNVPATNLIIDEGDVSFSYEPDTNSIRDKVGIVENSMKVVNGDEHLNYVYQPEGLKKVYKMDFAGYNAPGWWFTMPNADGSVGTVWQNKFYTNPNSGYGWAGLAYTAPASGKISIIGVTARSAITEKGDDGSLLGTDGEWAKWDLYVVSQDGFRNVARDTIVPNQMKYIGDVSGTQDIQLKKGEVLFLRYACSSPWKVSCMTIGFNFVGDPVDSFEGWQVSEGVTGESFSTIQGENNTYYAYGQADGKYWLFDTEEEAYKGGNIYANVTVTATETEISSAFETMRIYKSIGDGEASLKGNFFQTTFDNSEVTLSIFKRAYNGESWDAPTLLYTQTTNQRKVFAEFSLTETLCNGDLLFVVLMKEGEITNSQTVSGQLNVDFTFTVSETKEEVEGVGAVISKMVEDQFAETQGETGWFYAYGSPEHYALMEYGFGKVDYNCWSGPEWNNRIEVGKVCPSPYSGSLLIYVAPANGIFRAEGNFGIDSTDSWNDVIVSVLHNKDNVMEKKVAFDDDTLYAFSVEKEVKKGDLIIFYVANAKGDTVAYYTEVLLNFAYELETEETDLLTKDELVQYISPKKSYEEYIGIENNYTKQEEATFTEESAQKGCGSSLECGVLFVLFASLGLCLIRRKYNEKND